MRQDFDAQLQGTLAEARAELEKSMDEQMRGVVLANKKLQQEARFFYVLFEHVHSFFVNVQTRYFELFSLV